MELDEHLSLIYPRWLRELVSDAETFPKPRALYVSSGTAPILVLSVMQGMFSVSEFKWDASPMEGRFIRAKRESIPLSAVKHVSLNQTIGDVAALVGDPERLETRATITLTADLGVVGKEVALPLADDDYGHNPERRSLVVRTFIAVVESSMQ